MALLRYNSHTIQFTHLKCVIYCFFIILTGLCNCHHSIILDHFYIPPKKFHTHSHSFLPPPSSLNLLSVSMDLHILDILYEWNHTTCGLLCLSSFSWYYVFKVPTCCSVYRYFIPFHRQIILYGNTTFCFPIQFCWFYFFFFWSIMSKAAVKILVQVCMDVCFH